MCPNLFAVDCSPSYEGMALASMTILFGFLVAICVVNFVASLSLFIVVT